MNDNRCEVGNHDMAESEDVHRCAHCYRRLCNAHMGNPNALPGDQVACIDHVEEVKRLEAHFEYSRSRFRQERRA